ncbi:AraC family transcriptional regulator with amidase-like domain [Tepidamorphus gemmatus]|jgi:transcriptional regulator GlxA family with amidase domain|uniref:AraC family transcriptional regulator with amidase-like domain n=1 Tax=Tepidamorphus gemmatus TaxID=747076 RepID=A0A4R3MA77_9HYPH|nr:GlxA family transcriptional regulator [Tepidamorphus gemmatus]TCT08717.1 AraC family transcriptional regulator with amidase-like domain [Tepidamorphus gemmatus]
MDASVARSRRIVFFLVPNFSMIAFATAIEPLRLANRQIGQSFYKWRLVTLDGGPGLASNGVQVAVDGSLEDEKRRFPTDEKPDMFFVCSGVHVEKFDSKALYSWLRQLNRSGVTVGAMCTGAWVLAKAGLLDGKRCAIHWENLPGFAEAFPEADIYADLFEVDKNIYTCAGGTASLDMMLHLIDQDLGETVVNRVCEQALTDRVRNPHDRQRLPLRARLGIHNTKVLTIIELMEANIAEPLTLVELARFAGLSRRQIERLFRRTMGRSPARYYLELRLDRARHLLLQSNLPVVEVAVACGFVSASHFSKCYREFYGRSPLMERRERELAE